MRFLNELYTKYDELLDVYGVYKVETVGDWYVFKKKLDGSRRWLV